MQENDLIDLKNEIADGASTFYSKGTKDYPQGTKKRFLRQMVGSSATGDKKTFRFKKGIVLSEPQQKEIAELLVKEASKKGKDSVLAHTVLPQGFDRNLLKEPGEKAVSMQNIALNSIESIEKELGKPQTSYWNRGVFFGGGGVAAGIIGGVLFGVGIGIPLLVPLILAVVAVAAIAVGIGLIIADMRETSRRDKNKADLDSHKAVISTLNIECGLEVKRTPVLPESKRGQFSSTFTNTKKPNTSIPAANTDAGKSQTPGSQL